MRRIEYLNNKVRHDDWFVQDDLLGGPIWASESVELPEYTGLEGMVTSINGYCPKITPGLIPFDYPVEEPVSFTHGISPHDATTFTTQTFDFETNDPLSISTPSEEI
ncbi:MAG: hypothetical protein ACFFD1_00105 [Candidatus Thorarchaeota archaeon]